MKRLQGKLTYANVMVTVLAFIVLAGGTAYAASEMLPKGSVGTKQLTKGAVTPAKLSASAKKAMTGAVGPTGPTGPTGAAGTAGSTGAKGEAGATHVAVYTGELEENSTVFCPAGQVAVGGGGSTENKEELLWGSFPVDAAGEAVGAGQSAVGWSAGGETPAGVEVEVTAYVICAAP